VFRNILIDVLFKLSRVWNMVEAVVFVVGDVPVFIEGGEGKVAAIMYKTFILREHIFIIVENVKK
jgi:hypothetical protein